MKDKKQVRATLIKIANENPELRKTILAAVSEYDTQKTAADSYGESESLITKAREQVMSFSGYMKVLKGVQDTMQSLLTKGEAGRTTRSAKVSVSSMKFDMKDLIATTKSEGSSGSYQTKISHSPSRGFNCTCQDKAIRGKSKGPCKHAIALSKAFLDKEITPELERVNKALETMISGLKVLPE